MKILTSSLLALGLLRPMCSAVAQSAVDLPVTPGATTFTNISNSRFGVPYQNFPAVPNEPIFKIDLYGYETGSFSSSNWGKGLLIRRSGTASRGSGIVWDRAGQNNGANACNYFIAGPSNQTSTKGDYFTGIFAGAPDATGQVTNISRIDGCDDTTPWLQSDSRRGHTQYMRDVYLFRENGTTVHPNLGINVGEDGTAASLHVACQLDAGGNPVAGSGTVRFGCLPDLDETRLIGCDADGDLTYVPLPVSANGCASPNTVVRNVGGNLVCSQIWDDLATVGIGLTGASQKLEVAGNTRAAEFHATAEQSGYKLGNVAQTVLAHGNTGSFGALSLGYGAGLIGDMGTYLGDGAGAALTTGYENTLAGYNSGGSLNDGWGNATFGSNAGSSLVGGSGNTMIGRRSGVNSGGTHNTFVGFNCGIVDITGFANVAVGSVWSNNPANDISGPAASDLCNTGTFGFAASVTTAHTQRFGSNAVQRWGFGVDPTDVTRVISVNLQPVNSLQWGACPSMPIQGICAQAYMNNDGIWNTADCDEKAFELEEADYAEVLQALQKMPVVYWQNSQAGSNRHLAIPGSAIARELGLGAGSGTTNTVDPAGIALAAIKGMSEVVSEQQAIIDDKQTQIDALNERLERLEQLLVNEGKAQGLGLNGENATTSGSALRISPNPFSERTSITYQVNCACRVRLEVSTADGKPLKTLLDEQRAVGSYTFEWNTSDITPGMYFCTLLVDGKPSVKQAVKVN